MKFQAFSYKVIVKPKQLVTKTASGLVLAIDTKIHEAAVDQGIVVDIGEDAFSAFKPKRPFAGLEVGDIVVYSKYAGKPLLDDTEIDPDTKEPTKYIALLDDDIVCKVKQEVK